MATAAREKTKYPGVTYHTSQDGEKIFYIRYRLPGEGKQVEEKAGKASHGMTAARAAVLRGERMEGRALTNTQKREKEEAEKNIPTLKRLFKIYIDTITKERTKKTDISDFKKLEVLHNKHIEEIKTKDIEKLKFEMQNQFSNKYISNVLTLLTRIINYNVKSGLIELPSTKQLMIIKPRFDNKKTEYLDDDKQEKLIKILESEEGIHKEGAIYMHLIMLTGIRRSAALALKWDDIDTKTKRIRLRGEEAKKGITNYIPLTDNVENLLNKLEKSNSPYLFPSPKSPEEHRESFTKAVNKFRKQAGLDADFRPLHGLRHNFATKIASSGKVDLYTLQKLLTHESPEMTQRYAHLADEALYRAANIGISEILNKKDDAGS